MFADGLWLSGMTVHIHREGMPIPEDMQKNYIRLTLSPTQIAAISAVLGLGMRSGELLCYTDEFINHAMMDPEDDTIKSSYRLLTTDIGEAKRVVKTVYQPIADNEVVSNSVVASKTGEYSWDSNALQKNIAKEHGNQFWNGGFMTMNGSSTFLDEGEDDGLLFDDAPAEPEETIEPEDALASYDIVKDDRS